MKYYLGVDPGDNTGYILLDEDYKIEDVGTLDSFNDIEGAAKYLIDLFYKIKGRGDEITCIIEDFILSAHLARGVALRDPHLVTAGTRHILGYVLPKENVIIQIPNMKAGCPDEELKVLHLWQGMSRHARDAARHVVVYRRKIDTSSLKKREKENSISSAYRRAVSESTSVIR